MLTTMANAFYSLYSHVSRTPLQKLSQPEFTFYSSPVERMERFRSSIRSEPRSPVERLKDTVSKMCLYTGSLRGSESTSPQPSPKKRCSLPDVGHLVREKIEPGAVKKLNLAESNGSNSMADVRLAGEGPKCWHSRKEAQAEEPSASDTHHSRNKICCIKSKNTVVDGPNIKAVSVDNKSQGVRRPLLLETVDRADSCFALCQLDPNGTEVASAATEEPLSCRGAKTNTASRVCSGTKHLDTSLKTNVAFDSSTNPPGLLPVQTSPSSLHQCCITLSSWDGQDKSYQEQAYQESLNKKDIRYLGPAVHQNQSFLSSNLQQVNSFELEEVCYLFIEHRF